MRFCRRAAVAAVLLIVVSGGAAAQDTRPRVPDSVRLDAAAGRRVRVIVGLREAAQAEGRLSRADVDRQRARIRRSADELLLRLPASARGVRRFTTIPYFAADVDPATLLQLQGDTGVSSIEEDAVSTPALAESVPLVGAPAAWQAGATGAGWTVAILDTGVDAAHPFLAGKVVSQACYSNAAGVSAGIPFCPGGTTTSLGAGAGLNCSAAFAGCNHGTHVAGIAAGRGSTFSGVARDAGVIAVQIFTGFPASICGGTPCVGSFSSDQILGLERVLALKDTYRIAAVNMSLGGSLVYTDTASCDADNPSRKAAIDNLRSVGIATVVSAGNGGYASALSAPGCISSAISVGATTKSDAVSSFSNAAPFLSVVAPGSSIVSSIPGGGFSALSGTSMAAPHVTGAWALLKTLAPAASVGDILSAMRGTGASIADTRLTPAPVYPRLRVDAALALVAPSEIAIDTPSANTHLTQPFAIAGWALARAVASGTGVDAVHVYAVNSGGGAAFLGAAAYGGARQDVAGIFGERFGGSGFSLSVSGLPPGPYLLVAYAHNAANGSFDMWATRSVVIDAVSLAGGAIDQPAAGAAVGQAFTIAGWALDLGAAAGTGVDAIHAYAVASATGAATFLGAAGGGARRDDVGAAFGAQFRDSGYAFAVRAPAPGDYTLVVYARSAVSGSWSWQTRAIRVRAAGLPAMAIDPPADGLVTSGPITITGWAVDLDAADGPGVDVLHVSVIPSNGSPAIFAAAVPTGESRVDVGAAFGARFSTAGYRVSVGGLAPGTYHLAVHAHSTVTGTFSQWRVVTVTIVP